MGGAPTPARDYGNSTVWEDRADIAFVAAHSLILLTTSVAGTAANIFVLVAVYHQKSLQTSNNALLVNLAIIDILRCVIDCPALLTIVVVVYHRRRVDAMICDTQVASFSFSCCIQLLTLACISAERYQAVAQPFKTSQRRKRIMVLIPLTWTLAFLATVFCLLFVKDSLVNVRCRGSRRETLSSYDTFGLYMLLPLWAACFTVIIGFYALIFTLVRSHNRKIFDKGTTPKKDTIVNKHGAEDVTAVQWGHRQSEQTQTNLNKCAAQDEQNFAESNVSKKDSSAAPPTPPTASQCVCIISKDEEENKTGGIVDLETEPRGFAVETEKKAFTAEQFNTCVTEVEAEPSNEGDAAGIKSSATKASRTPDMENHSYEYVNIKHIEDSGCHGSSPAQVGNPETASVLPIEPKHAVSSEGGETSAVTTMHRVLPLPLASSVSAPGKEATKQTVAVEGAVCMMPSKASRDRVNKRKESKMAKRAGFIIITFLLLWLPLITTILVNFAVYKINNAQIKILQDAEVLSVSVACVTSLSDPLIYAAVNPQFRAEYYRMKKRFKSIFIEK